MKFPRLIGILPLFSTILVALSVGLFGCTSTEKFDVSTPEGAFKQAEAYESDERFEEAIQHFSEVKNKYPYSRFATLAEMRIADLHFKREAYIEAAAAYQLFKEFHPKHPQADYVTFRLAMSYFNQLPNSIDRDLSVADKALIYFDEVITSYPNSQYVAEAKEKKSSTLSMLASKEMYVANFYAKREQWTSALKRYEGVLRQFSNLGFDSEALYGAAKSAILSGERERGGQHLKNLYRLFPASNEAKRAKNEFQNLGAK